MTEYELNPFQELMQLRRRFNEIFERSFTGSLTESAVQSSWSPPLDVYREGDRVLVQVELPGVDREDVDIQIKGSRLTISGMRKPACGAGQAVFHRVERQHGPFERSLSITEPIEVDRVRARYDDGVLTVELPLRLRPQERKIELTED